MIRHFLMPSHSCSRRLGRVVDHHIIMLLKMYDARLKYERSMYSNTNGIHGMECRFLHEVYCLRTNISVDLQPSIFNHRSCCTQSPTISVSWAMQNEISALPSDQGSPCQQSNAHETHLKCSQKKAPPTEYFHILHTTQRGARREQGFGRPIPAHAMQL